MNDIAMTVIMILSGVSFGLSAALWVDAPWEDRATGTERKRHNDVKPNRAGQDEPEVASKA